MADAPNDNRAARFPVAIKGVVTIDGRVCLLFNEHDEWELPGGKLEPGESPQTCLALDETDALNMPEGYKDSIRRALN